MFSKNEIKTFIITFGKRWLFPDFSNKVTWFVTTIGAGVIVTPTPFKVILVNWLVDTFNLNAGEHYSLADIGSSSADYWLGFCLILVALLHNLFSKWLSAQEAILFRNEQNKILEVDKNIFDEFLKLFPTTSNSSYMLGQHDFGSSFSRDSLSEIHRFVNDWNCPEKEFISPELEALRKDFLDLCSEFCSLLAVKSSPTGSGQMQSVIPDHVRGHKWPDWVEEDVEKVNDKATEVFNHHQEFIKIMRVKLKC